MDELLGWWISHGGTAPLISMADWVSFWLDSGNQWVCSLSWEQCAVTLGCAGWSWCARVTVRLSLSQILQPSFSWMALPVITSELWMTDSHAPLWLLQGQTGKVAFMRRLLLGLNSKGKNSRCKGFIRWSHEILEDHSTVTSWLGDLGDSHCGFQPQNFRQMMTIEILAALCDSVCSFTLLAFLALLLTRWRVACTNRKWGYHHAREDCSPMVREEFIRHAECHMQVRPPGIDFRANSSPSQPPSLLQQPPGRLCTRSNDSSTCSSWMQCGNCICKLVLYNKVYNIVKYEKYCEIWWNPGNTDRLIFLILYSISQ